MTPEVVKKRNRELLLSNDKSSILNLSEARKRSYSSKIRKIPEKLDAKFSRLRGSVRVLKPGEVPCGGEFCNLISLGLLN